MYCSRCGSLINDDLNFCSRCGERVNKNEIAESTKKQSNILDTLATTAICLGGGGLLFFVGLIAVLLGNQMLPQVVILISFLYLAAWFGICFKLLRQLSNVVEADLEERKLQRTESTQPVRLAAPTTAQLEEHREPIMSVTENTTRTLDKVESKI